MRTSLGQWALSVSGMLPIRRCQISAICPVRAEATFPLPPIFAKVMIPRWLVMGYFEAVLQAKGLSIKDARNKDLAGGLGGLHHLWSRLFLSVGWIRGGGIARAGSEADIAIDALRFNCGQRLESLDEGTLTSGFIRISVCA